MLLKTRKTLILVSVLAIVIGISTIAYITKNQTVSPPKASTKVTQVTIQYFKKHNIPLTVNAYGSTISPNSIQLTAKAVGIVSTINFQPGKPVKKGQLLLTIALSNASDTLNIKMLQTQTEQSQLHYRELLKANKTMPGSISHDDVQTAFFNYQHNLAEYNNALALTDIKAPISGIVSDTNLSTGDTVNVGDKLLSIYDHTNLQLIYTLPSQYADKIKLGQPIIFTSSDNNKAYHAQVTYISPQLDAGSGEIMMRANFSNNSSLQANTFGSLTQILDSQRQVLALPQALIQSDEKGFYVYVVKFNKVTKQYLQTGNISADGYIEIIDGLTTNTPVITSDYSTLSLGQNVTTVQSR